MLKFTILIFPLVLTIIFLVSCTPPFHAEGEKLIQMYINSVQKRDFKTLYTLKANIQDEVKNLTEEEKADHFKDFQWQMERKYKAYKKGREIGKLNFDADGVVLIKGFVLGKGTFYQPVNWIQVSDINAFIDTTIEFGYGHINYSTFPDGTIIYLMGYPIGQVEKLYIQRSGKVAKKVMKEATVRWWFEKKKISDDSASSWYIKSIEALSDSVKYETVTWIF